MRLAKYSIDSRFVKDSQTLSVNGAVRATRTVNSEYDTGLNLYLFACNKDGSPDYYTKGRIYSLRIWDLADGERDSLLRDFRPCLDGNGVPCLYDAVTDGYFYDARSGTFAYKTLDPPQAATVDHYVEYIQSDGTQFIDTGIIPMHGMKSSLRMSFVQVPADGGILCLRENGHRFYLAHYYPGNKGFFYANSGTANIPANDHLATAGTIYTIQTDVFRNVRNFNVNGEEVGPRYDGDKTDTAMLTKTLYLFGLHDDDTFRYPSSMKLYECTIWASPLNLRSDGELVMLADYHPCVDTDGVAGLYDTVSGRILYNSRSTGNAFVAGPSLSTAARVIASNGTEFEGTASPAYGTDDTVAQGNVTTYTCTRFVTNEVGTLFECVGYTTATSEDGSFWSAESALVGSRSATLEYPGGWWRLTWNWQRAGFHISTITPEGATVSVASQETDYPEGYYVDNESVVFTASETDGDGNTFAGWTGDIPSGVFDARRSIPIVANADKTITALYRHEWRIESISGSVTNITDGIWTVEVENGVVGRISEGYGPLDFTNVERDLGFKITSFKSWMPNTSHLGPKNITAIIAPDATSVEALTFVDCKYLERAVLSPALNHLGRSAFYRCTALTSISPSLSQYFSQAVNMTTNDIFVFRYCGNLAEDIVVERRKSAGPLVLPDSYFEQAGIISVDFSKCRGRVDLRTFDYGGMGGDYLGTFRRCANMRTMTLNPNLVEIPRGMCWGHERLTDLYITGRLPAPEDIGGFYSFEFHKLRIHVSKTLNPNVVADLQLREPTEAEMALATFPREAYEAGKLLGVWDQPTAGWGELESDGKFRQMWVLDWTPPSETATYLLVR
ncbi:MAG: leucine-rich repeat protein [Kiritimatiellae bacterium]|nr:leucine-rich repeat protein [Kiritimatiellia bacterium]